MRRVIFLLTAAATVVVTTLLSGSSVLAQAQGQGQEQRACFGYYADATSPEVPDLGPGSYVSGITTAAPPGTVDEFAGFVQEVQQARPCPANPDELKTELERAAES